MNLLLFLRTVRNLRPIQIVHRVRLRTQRLVMGGFPNATARILARRAPTAVGWPAGFRPLACLQPNGFPSAEANAEGTFEFLNREVTLGSPPAWHPERVDRLWLFHLYYFDWAFSFANHVERAWAQTQFLALWRSWSGDTVVGRRDDWAPYVVSCRTWNLCAGFASLIQGTGAEREFVEQLTLHAGYVRANLELDVGGNHLIKNIKALVGAGVFLGDEALLNKGLQLLGDAIPRQILDDGGHYELSPSYHCQVLEDLVDIDGLLRSVEREDEEGFVDLRPTIGRMRQWLGAMQMPDGEIPLLNDSWPVGAKQVNRLLPIQSEERLTVLRESGYVVVRPRPGTQLIVDVGPPGPTDLPAHSHADALSFVLTVDGKRMIVDTGVSTYEQGDTRQYQRSTEAHNTVEIDGESQSEVWSSFRVARRAQVSLLEAEERGETIVVAGSHDGYRRLHGRPVHVRTWFVTADGMTVEDEIRGHGAHRITQRLVLAPEIGILHNPDGGWVTSSGVIIRGARGERGWSTELIEVGTGFGRLGRTECLVSTGRYELPARRSFTIRFGGLRT